MLICYETAKNCIAGNDCSGLLILQGRNDGIVKSLIIIVSPLGQGWPIY